LSAQSGFERISSRNLGCGGNDGLVDPGIRGWMRDCFGPRVATAGFEVVFDQKLEVLAQFAILEGRRSAFD
jgi:hypothetical protein